MLKRLPDGVIGNTSDSESEESRFDPWSGNNGFSVIAGEQFFLTGEPALTKVLASREVFPDE